MASRRTHWIVAVLGLAVLGGGAWYWQNRGTGVAKPAEGATMAGSTMPGASASGGTGGGRPGGGPGGMPTVEVGKVEAITLTDDAQAVGSLRSRQGVVLRPEVSGRIAHIGFADGQRVRRGQLLVQLDDTLQQAQLQQAEAQASIARTNLQRSRELLAQGFVSQSSVDQNAAALQVAQAQVALAQAQLARMRILAPFDATAGIRQANVGDYLKDGADIVNLEDLSSVLVDFRLPERYLSRVKPGLPVDVAVDALAGREFKGRVEAIDVQVDANGRAMLVRARIANADAVLKPGMFARPRIVFAVRENALVVPEEALVPLGNKQYLFVVAPGAGGPATARRVEARLGLRIPGKVELLDGVKAGDLVVTAGHARLGRSEATPVRVIDLSAPAPAAGGRANRPPGAASAAGGNGGAASGPGAPRGGVPA